MPFFFKVKKFQNRIPNLIKAKKVDIANDKKNVVFKEYKTKI